MPPPMLSKTNGPRNGARLHFILSQRSERRGRNADLVAGRSGLDHGFFPMDQATEIVFLGSRFGKRDGVALLVLGTGLRPSPFSHIGLFFRVHVDALVSGSRGIDDIHAAQALVGDEEELAVR